ncbi:MAG: nucleoside deaminase [Dehalococcoidia bacterium]
MDQEDFMRLAIAEGERSIAEGGRAFACVLVKDGEVVATGRNRVIQDGDPTSHAELDIIRAYTRESGVSDLEGYVMYTDCEPCAMCSSAIAWANISTVVFGADRTDGPTSYSRQVDLSCEEVLRRSGKQVEVIPHVLRSECAALFE